MMVACRGIGSEHGKAVSSTGSYFISFNCMAAKAREIACGLVCSRHRCARRLRSQSTSRVRIYVQSDCVNESLLSPQVFACLCMDDTQSLYPPGPIPVIGGAVDRPMSLDVAALRAHESVHLEPFDLRCFSTGRFIRSVENDRGVQLRALLDAAGICRRGNMDYKRTVFLAHAHDGYAVTFSWHELFNSPIGDSVLVAYASADVPLDIEDGLPILVSGADTVRAPRHVKRLAGVNALVLDSPIEP